MKNFWSNKSTRGTAIGTVVGIVSLIAYTIYGMMFQYFDTAVFAAILLSIVFAALNVVYRKIKFPIFDLLAVLSMSFAIGICFMNSFPVWADNLTGITMYGSRGGLPPIIAVLVLLIAANVGDICACFAEKEDK